MSANSQTDLGIAGIDDIKPLDENRSPVFSARQSVIGRTVAVKILNPHNDPLLPRRFDRRRKDFVKYTSSSHVVPLYDSGETSNGKPYIVMPYFKIGSLQDQINHGKMPWHLAARIVQRVTESVALAHASDISLGDIKPSSILLSDPETPRIAVYGMATRRFDDGGPSFVAPEVDKDSEPLPASDVYSLAMTLGALITGEAPSRSTPTDQYLEKVKPLVPPRIYEVIEHGTSPALSNRYGSAKHLANVLVGAISAETTSRITTKSSTLISSSNSKPEPASAKAEEPKSDIGPITVDELLGPVTSADGEDSEATDAGIGSKYSRKDDESNQVNSPTSSNNGVDTLVHLGSEAVSQAVSQFKTTAEIAGTDVGPGSTVGDSQASEDVVEGKPENASAQGSGSNISISEESTRGLNPSFPPQNPTNGPMSATEQVDITSLNAPIEAPKPASDNPDSDLFRQTRVFGASDNVVEDPWAASSQPEPPQPQVSHNPGPGPRMASGTPYRSGPRSRPSESRRNQHQTESDSLWLSMQDSWHSNRQWLTLALAGGVIVAISLITLSVVKGSGGDSTSTGADLPPLTTQPEESATPEFNPPPAASPSNTEVDSEPASPATRATTKSTSGTPKPTTARPTTTVQQPTTTVEQPTTTNAVEPTTTAAPATTVAPTTVAPPEE